MPPYQGHDSYSRDAATPQGTAPAPDSTAEKLPALEEYALPGTTPERAYDDIARLAAQICNTPIALITLIDRERLWLKARVGLHAEPAGGDIVFCTDTLLGGREMFEVRDAAADPRYADSPLVSGAPHIRYYIGVPLVTPEGHALGVLCAIDRVPRELGEDQRAGLRALARQVMELFELRRTRARLEDAQKRLVSNDGRYRVIAGNIPGMVFHACALRPWRIDEVSAGVESLTGYPPSYFERNPGGWESVMLDEDVDRVERELAAQMERAPQMRAEYRIRRRDGRVCWVEGRAGRPYPGPNGELMFDGLVTGIDQQHRARARLAESEQRFRFLTQSVPEVIWIAGPDGSMEFVSDRACEQYGLEPSTLLGDSWKHLVHAEDLGPFTTAWAHALRTAGPFAAQIRARCADGSYRWHQVRARALTDPDGRPNKWFGSNTDIEDMLRAKEAAEAATHRRTAFLSTMSHEIRSPLNSVLGFSDLLADTELTPRQQDFLQAIRDSGDHLLGVVNDILDFSKIEYGGLHLEKTSFEPHELVEAALQLVSHSAHAKGLELAYGTADDLPRTCEADAVRVRQVLVNLLGNAVKFTSSGEVIVQLSAQALPNGLHDFVFEVRDTGIGIPPEVHSRLFLEFSQAELSTAREFGGTGLGLAISRRIVEAHGGRIELDSEPGRGSVFRVHLPAPAGPPADESGALVLRGARALLVNGSPTCLEILQTQLRRWGVSALCLQHPGQALAAVERGERFDLAIIDRDLPGLDGVELARQFPPRLALPTVLLSRLGAATPDDARDVAVVVSKPVRRQAFMDALVQALCPTAAQRPPAAPEQVRAAEVPELAILLAEDNPTNQMLARLLLEKLGYTTIDLVEDGLQVLARIDDTRYDVVLMDIEMPGLGGLEATRRIRADLPPAWQPQIIAMTAGVLPEDRERCRAAGTDDFLAKPITLHQLAAAMNRAASRRGQKR